jgi:hypothetical protein
MQKDFFCHYPVLPTPSKFFRPENPKNSAAGEKLRPLTIFPYRSGLYCFLKRFLPHKTKKKLATYVE